MKKWKEKWNYHPNFLGEVSDQARRDFTPPRIANLYNVKSLDWTNFERKMIEKILAVSKNFFKVNVIKPIKVHSEQIIILDREEFKDKVSDRESDSGKCSTGYVYVCRNDDRSVFLNDFLHELSHLFSFYSLSIKENKKNRMIDMRQLGYSIKKFQEDCSYDGLNEAATELLAKSILREFLKENPNILTDKEVEKALYYLAYPYHATLLEEVIFNLTSDNVLVAPLFKSYFDGSHDFLDLLRKELPAAHLAFRKMDATKKSALEAAFLIGGSSLLDIITGIINEP